MHREMTTFYEVWAFRHAYDGRGYKLAKFRDKQHALYFVNLVLQRKGQQDEQYRVIPIDRTYL